MRIDSDAIHYGRNKDIGTYRDDRYVRCRKCGHICHLDRDRRSHDGDHAGMGIKINATAVPRNFTEV
jgi:hypothetical protein